MTLSKDDKGPERFHSQPWSPWRSSRCSSPPSSPPASRILPPSPCRRSVERCHPGLVHRRVDIEEPPSDVHQIDDLVHNNVRCGKGRSENLLHWVCIEICSELQGVTWWGDVLDISKFDRIGREEALTEPPVGDVGKNTIKIKMYLTNLHVICRSRSAAQYGIDRHRHLKKPFPEFTIQSWKRPGKLNVRARVWPWETDWCHKTAQRPVPHNALCKGRGKNIIT